MSTSVSGKESGESGQGKGREGIRRCRLSFLLFVHHHSCKLQRKEPNTVNS